MLIALHKYSGHTKASITLPNGAAYLRSTQQPYNIPINIIACSEKFPFNPGIDPCWTAALLNIVATKCFVN